MFLKGRAQSTANRNRRIRIRNAIEQGSLPGLMVGIIEKNPWESGFFSKFKQNNICV
jgi:hypothetical protein